MTRTPSKTKTAAKRTSARKPAARAKKASASKKGVPADEVATSTLTEVLEQTKIEAVSEIEEVLESVLADKISSGIRSEIEGLKKEIIDDVMGTIMPLLEALKKIADEAPQPVGPDGAEAPSSATSALGGAVPSLEEMQKAALETIRTQEKLMTGSEHILEELQKARQALAKTRKRGVKGYWLDQLMKNSSGEKGGNNK